MPNKKESETEAVTKEIAKETKYAKEELRKACVKLFGVTSSTFAGATTELPDGDYTVSEVKEHIKTWLEKEGK